MWFLVLILCADPYTGVAQNILVCSVWCTYGSLFHVSLYSIQSVHLATCKSSMYASPKQCLNRMTHSTGHFMPTRWSTASTKFACVLVDMNIGFRLCGSLNVNLVLHTSNVISCAHSLWRSMFVGSSKEYISVRHGVCMDRFVFNFLRVHCSMQLPMYESQNILSIRMTRACFSPERVGNTVSTKFACAGIGHRVSTFW